MSNAAGMYWDVKNSGWDSIPFKLELLTLLPLSCWCKDMRGWSQDYLYRKWFAYTAASSSFFGQNLFGSLNSQQDFHSYLTRTDIIRSFSSMNQSKNNLTRGGKSGWQTIYCGLILIPILCSGRGEKYMHLMLLGFSGSATYCSKETHMLMIEWMAVNMF